MKRKNKNWYTKGTENQSQFFFYTNDTPTGRKSGIMITFVPLSEGGSRIYSKRKCINLDNLVEVEHLVTDENREGVYGHLNNALNICIIGGQK